MTINLTNSPPWILAAMLIAGAAASAAPAADATEAPLPSLLQRGEQTLAVIEKTYAMRGRDSDMHYLEEVRPNDPTFQSHAVYAWGVGLQFSALTAAAKADPQQYRAMMLRDAHTVQAYWFIDKAGLGGFYAPHPTSADRYYDDNAWICLDYCEAYELTGHKPLLDAARHTMHFILSGRDNKLGDGIYWHEQKKTSKNTCINAPATVCALRLYKLTGDESYLDTATQLYAWTRSHLQDPADGLYFDSINLNGKIAKAKYSYNTALMLRAACLFYDQTGDLAYLKEAGRLAKAAEAKWFKADGSSNDVSYFGHLLIEAMLDYGQRAKDPHWASLATRTCDWLWRYNRGPDGHFPEHWDTRSEKPLERYKLMWDASDARLFFRVAEVVGE